MRRSILLFALVACSARSHHNGAMGDGGSGGSDDGPPDASPVIPPPPPPGAFPLWVAPSLEMVLQNAPARTDTQIELWAARGEAESFQIVVQAPSGGLTHVTTSAVDLVALGGSVTIDKSQVTLYREYFVQSSGSPNWNGSNQPLGPGLYPEGLVPFVDPATGQPITGAQIEAAPFTVAAGQAQPLWVDLTVPRDAKPGLYYGVFDVTSDQGDAKVAVVLHVRKFVLPLKPALRSSFLANNGTLAVAQELLANRINIDNAPTADERSLIDNDGYEIRGAGFWSGADVGNCSMSQPPAAASFVSDAATHQADIDLYDYSADEIGNCSGLVPTVIAWGKAIHASRMKNLVTMAPRTDLFDDGTGTGRSAVDIWVVLPVTYNGATSAIAQALAKGDEVWSYNTLVQDAYSPKWELDWDPINERLQPGFLSQSMSLTGLLYWRVDDWGSDPWNTALGAIDQGDGVMVYPGGPIGISGVAPSIRLKRLRDGVDDYDYIDLLKQLGHGADAVAASQAIAPDWTNWTRSHDAVETLRNQLGDQIDALTP